MIALSPDPLDLAPLLAAVSDPDHGGISAFMGTTRRGEGEGQVVELFYEAYEELALSEMAAVAGEAAARFGARVAVAHRVGRVAVGEASVAVAASAGHRPAAFAACRYVIDELKARAPIWKQAVYDDGATAWRDGVRAPDPAGAAR
jgi:molybdopterin synthase catalytic subunit